MTLAKIIVCIQKNQAFIINNQIASNRAGKFYLVPVYKKIIFISVISYVSLIIKRAPVFIFV